MLHYKQIFSMRNRAFTLQLLIDLCITSTICTARSVVAEIAIWHRLMMIDGWIQQQFNWAVIEVVRFRVLQFSRNFDFSLATISDHIFSLNDFSLTTQFRDRKHSPIDNTICHKYLKMCATKKLSIKSLGNANNHPLMNFVWFLIQKKRAKFINLRYLYPL